MTASTSKNHLKIVFILAVCFIIPLASSHGHSHHDGHSHDENPSFKYSRQANEHAHNSPGGQTTTEQHHDKPKARDTLTLWVEAIGSTLLISAAPFVILFFIPIDNKAEHQSLLKILLSFASGGLLGDAFLHLIPHALLANSASNSKDPHSHSHSHSHSHGPGESEVHGHDLSVGLGVLGGIVVFLMVEKFVRIVKGGHGHSHSKGPSVSKEPSKDGDGDARTCVDENSEREREDDPCDDEDAVKEKETEKEPLSPKAEVADEGKNTKLGKFLV